jgi:hypothetical protein
MSTHSSRTRVFAAALMVGLVGLVSAACVAPAPSVPFYGIHFTTPSTGYPAQTYKLTATATSKLPVQLTLDATSTGCSLGASTTTGVTTNAIVSYDSIGTCVINANEPGDATHVASKQVQRKISIVPCPTLRAGIWTTTVLGKSFSGPVNVNGNLFDGSVDLTSLGVPGLTILAFNGSVACQTASGVINGTPLSGTLSPDGSTLTSSYQGIVVVLHAPAAAG